MSSVHNPHLKETVGEMLFVICNENGEWTLQHWWQQGLRSKSASELAGQIGYGNAAGFLFSKGITSAPTMPSTVDTVGINPITGTPFSPQPSIEMTNEEKEAEAERLFVLFDRLEHIGIGINPIRQAQEEGRLA